MMNVDSGTAAARRRQRRLRSWDDRRDDPGRDDAPYCPKGTEDGQGRGGGGKCDARRPTDTEVSTSGGAARCLSDPGPQRSDRIVRYSARKSPLLVVPALRGDVGVDGTTLRFLLGQNLSLKKKQEEEEEGDREKECQRLFVVPYERRSAEQRARIMALIKAKRKRKKRRTTTTSTTTTTKTATTTTTTTQVQTGCVAFCVAFVFVLAVDNEC